MFTAGLHAFLVFPSQTTTKRMHTVRSVVKAAMGLAPYEKRILEVIKVGYVCAATVWACAGRLFGAGFAAAWQGGCASSPRHLPPSACLKVAWWLICCQIHHVCGLLHCAWMRVWPEGH